jgi:hypothetical protein
MKKFLLATMVSLMVSGFAFSQEVPSEGGEESGGWYVANTSLAPLTEYIDDALKSSELLMAKTHGKKTQEHIWWYYYGQSMAHKNFRVAMKMFEEGKQLKPIKEPKNTKILNGINPSFN